MAFTDVEGSFFELALDQLVDCHKDAVAGNGDDQQVVLKRELDHEVRPVRKSASDGKQKCFDIAIHRVFEALIPFLQVLNKSMRRVYVFLLQQFPRRLHL